MRLSSIQSSAVRLSVNSTVHPRNQESNSTTLEHEEFERAVENYRLAIHRLVLRLLGWQDGAEDLVQEVFLSAWSAWRRRPEAAEIEFWLKRIAVNKSRSRLRRDAVRARWLGWLRRQAPGETAVSFEDLSAQQEEANRVRSAVAKLEPRQREVVVLYYLDQIDVRKIAELLGEKVNAVEVRLHRARKRLGELLADLMEEA